VASWRRKEAGPTEKRGERGGTGAPCPPPPKKKAKVRQCEGAPLLFFLKVRFFLDAGGGERKERGDQSGLRLGATIKILATGEERAVISMDCEGGGGKKPSRQPLAVEMLKKKKAKETPTIVQRNSLGGEK